jgi:hypothetical protein
MISKGCREDVTSEAVVRRLTNIAFFIKNEFSFLGVVAGFPEQYRHHLMNKRSHRVGTVH